jgi:hypothetical protein
MHVLGTLNHLLIAKDGDGNVYWPFYGVDNINVLTIGKGYQVKMQQQETLVVTGIAAIPQYVPVSVPCGWSIIGYLRNAAAPISDMLGSIVSDIIIVKNGGGNVYWPVYGVNHIVNMIPGEGYQLKAASPVVFYYSSNSAAFLKSVTLTSPVHYMQSLNTGNNMTLCIPDDAWFARPEYGDEIGIIGTNGQLAGSAVYNGGNIAVTIWGKDEYISYINEIAGSSEQVERNLVHGASFNNSSEYFNNYPGLSDGEGFIIWHWSKVTGEEALLDVEEWR